MKEHHLKTPLTREEQLYSKSLKYGRQTLSHWIILRTLCDGKPRPILDFIRNIKISSAAMTGLVKTLERDGLIKQKRGVDRRQRLLSLTLKGERMMKDFFFEADELIFMNAWIKECDLSFASFAVATALEQVGTLRPIDIVERLSMRHSSITAMIDGLVEHGYASRHEPPNDRRIKEIALTEKGQKMLDEYNEFRNTETALPA